MASSASPATSSGASGKALGYMKREEILGKPVVTTDAIIVGSVKDIAVSPDGKVALQVERKDEQGLEGPKEMFVGSEEIQAVGDVVLIKSPSKRSSATQVQTLVPPPMSSGYIYSQPPPFPVTSVSVTKMCPRCSYSNNTSSKFCIKCGSPLTT